MGSAGQAFGSKPYAGLGSTMQQGGRLIGQVGAAIDNGIKNASTALFSPAVKSVPQDAPTPAGIAGFKAGTPATNTASINTSQPAQPQTNIASAPQQTPTPVQTNTASGQQQNNSNTGSNIYNGVAYASPAEAQTKEQNDTYASQVQPQSTGPYLSSVNGLAGQQQGNQSTNTATNGLLGIASAPSAAVTAAEDQYNKLAQESPILQAEVAGNPNVAAEVSSGRGQVLGNQLSGQLQGAAQNVQNALTGQGQQITANTNAANIGLGAQSNQISAQNAAGGLAQPQAGASFFGSPVTGGVSGQGEGVVSQSLSNALQQVQSGADPATVRANLVSSYGAVAGTNFDTAMRNQTGGKYNPTASSASSQQSASQAAATGGQAFELGKGIAQLKAIQPLAVNFMKQSGLNPSDSQVWNAPINNYIKTLGNTAAGAQAQALMSDIQAAGQAIIANKTPGTPTSTVEQQAANDPSLLNWSQLDTVLSTWDKLGGTTQSVLQNQASNSGYTGYAGAPATAATSIPVGAANTSPGSGVTSPTGQFLGGAGLGVANDIESIGGAITGLASHFFQ